MNKIRLLEGIQSAFIVHSECIQSAFRVHSECLQIDNLKCLSFIKYQEVLALIDMKYKEKGLILAYGKDIKLE